MHRLLSRLLVAVDVTFGDPARTCVLMSRRELQALTQDSGHVWLRTTHTESIETMEQLQTELETLRQELAATKDESKKQLEELEQLRAETAETTRTHRTQVEEATRTRVMAEEEIRVLQRHEAETRAELKHLRALEQLRVEHREAIHREQNEVDRERRQAQEREQTLTEAFDLEKYSLQEQLEAVTAKLRSCQEEFDKAEDRVGHTIPLETEPLSTPHMEGGTDPIERTGTERADRGTEG